MIQTKTYAEILAHQGEFADAIAIYRNLQRRDPDDPELKRRLGQLEALLALRQPPAEKNPQVLKLESLLQRIRSRRR